MNGLAQSRIGCSALLWLTIAGVVLWLVWPTVGCGSATQTYVVSYGDTGHGIAAAIGVPFSELERLNPGVDWNHLHPGDPLRIPKPEVWRRKEALDGPVHIVRQGETGRGIAAHYAMPFSELVRLNDGVPWNALPPGTRLRIPDRADARPVESGREPSRLLEVFRPGADVVVAYRGQRLDTVNPAVVDPTGWPVADNLPLLGLDLEHRDGCDVDGSTVVSGRSRSRYEVEVAGHDARALAAAVAELAEREGGLVVFCRQG